jgi:hypothetical protein
MLFIATIVLAWVMWMASIPYAFRVMVGTFHDRRQHLLQLASALTMWASLAAISIGTGALIRDRLAGSHSAWVDLLGWGAMSAAAAFVLGHGLELQQHERLRTQFRGHFLVGAALGGWVYLTARLIAQVFA